LHKKGGYHSLRNPLLREPKWMQVGAAAAAADEHTKSVKKCDKRKEVVEDVAVIMKIAEDDDTAHCCG